MHLLPNPQTHRGHEQHRGTLKNTPSPNQIPNLYPPICIIRFGIIRFAREATSVLFVLVLFVLIIRFARKTLPSVLFVLRERPSHLYYSFCERDHPQRSPPAGRSFLGAHPGPHACTPAHTPHVHSCIIALSIFCPFGCVDSCLFARLFIQSLIICFSIFFICARKKFIFISLIFNVLQTNAFFININ